MHDAFPDRGARASAREVLEAPLRVAGATPRRFAPSTIARASGCSESERRSAIGQGLGPAVRGLGLGSHAHDSRQRGVLADSLDADPEAAPAATVPATTASPASFVTGRDSRR